MSQTITLPTRRDRDTGIVLFFLSLVTHFAVPPLALQFGIPRGQTVLYSSPIGMILMVVGLAFIFLSRKRITAENSLVVIKDGFLSRPLKLRYETIPTVKLSVYEEEHRGRVDEIWTVHLIESGRQYLIDRRVGQHSTCRSMAERLAKATQGSLIEVHDGKSHKFELNELDLCFVERVQQYPTLMGQPVEEPSDKVVNYRKGDDGIEIRWSFFRSGLFFEVFMIAGLLAGAAFVPLPAGIAGRGFSLYDIERAQGDYTYFALVAAFTVIALALLAGYRNRIHISPKTGAISQSTVWGIPVRGGKIPLTTLEHVGTNITSRGPYLQLISDKRILREMLPSTHIARWLAWEIRNYLAGLSFQEIGLPATGATASPKTSSDKEPVPPNVSAAQD